MVEEQYVSDETSKMLKEAGFKANCAFIRDDNQERLYCPTQALAARWLREVHRIVMDVAFVPPSVNGDVWQCFVGEMDDMVWKGDFEPSDRKYATYEEAFEYGLKRGLELIKK